MKQIEDRLAILKEKAEQNNIWRDIKEMTEQLFRDLRQYKIFRKIELNMNELGGSASFYYNTHSSDIHLKLWHNSGNFYISLIKTIDGFDHQIKNTFNETGVLTAPSLDEIERGILDFTATEIANRDYKQVLD